MVIKLIKSTFYNEANTARQLSAFVREAPQLSFGPRCEEFERMFAAYQGRRHCVFVNSGSSANLALIQALRNVGRLNHEDKVGFSAVTWSTNVMPLVQLGLAPVPVDVALDTLNVSPATLAKSLTHAPLQALFLTHALGLCDDLVSLVDLCEREGILLIEDTCEALGSIYQGRRLGNFGLASTFSFYVGHHLSTIEGGAVCTDDDELAIMLRIVRAHGWDRNLPEGEQRSLRQNHPLNSLFASRYTFYDLGFNLRPTEVAGFLGTVQLPYLPEIVQKRNMNWRRLAPALYGQDSRYYPVRYDHIDLVSNFAWPVVCRTREERDQLVAACNERIEIRPIVGGNIARQPFFRKYVAAPADLGQNSNADLIHNQGLYFGNNPDLTEEELRELQRVFVEPAFHLRQKATADRSLSGA